jgi:Zn-dependent protease
MDGPEHWLLGRLLPLIPLLLSLGVHEWAHAWSAWKLGDDTATRLGRKTMDPLAHIDLVGTLILPILGVPFGWAKPVPVNPLRFRPDVRMGTGVLLTAAAGPASNLVLAGLCTGSLALASRLSLPDVAVSAGSLGFLELMVRLNLVLAFFNLLPIPPLDGGRIVDALVPRPWRPAWDAFARVGPVAIIAIAILPTWLGFSVVSWPLAWAEALIEMARG